MTLQLPQKIKPFSSPHRYKAVYGGRGGGKSWSIASLLLVLGCQNPLRIACGREVQRSIKDSVKLLLDDRIAALGLEEFYESTAQEIKGKNGTLFIFPGLGKMTSETLKSMEGVDILWCEEAQTISSRTVEVVIPTIRKAGSEIWFSWNPRSANDPVEQLFRAGKNPDDSVVVNMNIDDNLFASKELLDARAYDRKNNQDRYAHVWLGHYEPHVVGALFTRQMFELHRKTEQDLPALHRLLVGIDPSITSHGDACGIVVAGLGEDSRGYVLDDSTMQASPRKWAQRAVALVDKWDADGIVVETNQGGEMVIDTLRSVRPSIRIIEVKATRGKHVRAEPISALYETGKISHAGTFEGLEGELCQFTPHGYEGDGSPNAADACIWALTELFPRIVMKRSAVKGTDIPDLGMIGWMG